MRRIITPKSAAFNACFMYGKIAVPLMLKVNYCYFVGRHYLESKITL